MDAEFPYSLFWNKPPQKALLGPMAAVFIIHLLLVLRMSLQELCRALLHGRQEERRVTVLGGIAYFSWVQSNQRVRVRVDYSCKIKKEEGGKSRTADKDSLLCTHDRSFYRSSSHQNICASALLFECPCHNPLSSQWWMHPPETILKKLFYATFLFLFFFFNICFLFCFLKSWWDVSIKGKVNVKLLELSFGNKRREQNRCTWEWT